MGIDLSNIHNTMVAVSGFPRSGTSAMMRMLYFGGIPVLVNELAAHYKGTPFNPHGAYELGDAGRAIRAHDQSWVVGKAVKMVTPYIRHIPVDWLDTIDIKVIFMLRDPNEIIASLLAMKSIWEEIPDESIKYARDYLTYHNVPTHYVRFRNMIDYPRTTIIGIEDFLNVTLDTVKAITAVDKKARYLHQDQATKPLDRIVTIPDGKTTEIWVDEEAGQEGNVTKQA